jgi:hypothetical protein
MYAKIWGAHTIADTEGWSGPATYAALREFADYRDPTTHELTGISAAYEVAFARTYIVNVPGATQKQAQATSGASSAVASR